MNPNCFLFPYPFPSFQCLNESQLGGGDVKSIDVRGEAGVGLLGAVRATPVIVSSFDVDGLSVARMSHPTKGELLLPDQGVDLDGVDVVELLQGLLDLGLVGLDVDDEDEGVVLLNLLHGALGVEGVDDDLVLVETGLVRDRLAGVLGGAGDNESLGAVEGGRVADLGLLVGVGLRSLHVSFGRPS